MAKQNKIDSISKSPITGNDSVVIIATDLAKYMKVGGEYSVHPVLANRLISHGKATLKQ